MNVSLWTQILQVIIALGILNVWLLRFRRDSPWRGGAAGDMKEEFRTYGLPVWFMKVVGTIKVLCALLLIAGLWVPALTAPAAMTLAVLMIGAVAMHLKVGDPWKRALPALTLLVLCLLVVGSHFFES